MMITMMVANLSDPSFMNIYEVFLSSGIFLSCDKVTVQDDGHMHAALCTLYQYTAKHHTVFFYVF